jgi:hypothetical protein
MKNLIALTMFVLWLLGAGPAAAFYPWRNHAAPFPFLFENDIDNHQQAQLKGDGSLSGYFYIWFTGVVTKDGYRVATHIDCSARLCTVGWTLDGEPVTATLLYQVRDDHPVFLVSRVGLPASAKGSCRYGDNEGSRNDDLRERVLASCAHRQGSRAPLRHQLQARPTRLYAKLAARRADRCWPVCDRQVRPRAA